jgi:hypothetical protein
MALKFKTGDLLMIPEDMPGARHWWRGKIVTVRIAFEDMGMYEVLFHDGQDFAYIEEKMLVPSRDTSVVPQS